MGAHTGNHQAPGEGCGLQIDQDSVLLGFEKVSQQGKPLSSPSVMDNRLHVLVSDTLLRKNNHFNRNCE